MKKKIAILATTLIMLVSVFALSACAAKEETFTNDDLGVSITMNSSFSKGTGYVGTAWCLTSPTAIFQLIVDESAGSSASQISETLYLNTMISLAGSTITTVITEPTTNENGLSYVTYYSKQNSVDFFFMDAVKRVGNVFYVLEFYCNKDKEEDFSAQFITWAESFTVSSTSTSAI